MYLTVWGHHHLQSSTLPTLTPFFSHRSLSLLHGFLTMHVVSGGPALPVLTSCRWPIVSQCPKSCPSRLLSRLPPSAITSFLHAQEPRRLSKGTLRCTGTFDSRTDLLGDSGARGGDRVPTASEDASMTFSQRPVRAGDAGPLPSRLWPRKLPLSPCCCYYHSSCRLACVQQPSLVRAHTSWVPPHSDCHLSEACTRRREGRRLLGPTRPSGWTFLSSVMLGWKRLCLPRGTAQLTVKQFPSQHLPPPWVWRCHGLEYFPGPRLRGNEGISDAYRRRKTTLEDVKRKDNQSAPMSQHPSLFTVH